MKTAPKREQFNVRVTAEELQELQERADSYGLPLSTYTRLILLNAKGFDVRIVA